MVPVRAAVSSDAHATLFANRVFDLVCYGGLNHKVDSQGGVLISALIEAL